MFTLTKRKFAKSILVVTAAIGMAATTPASANSSTNAATSADVTEAVRDAQDTGLTNGDARFRELFASWSALDAVPPIAPDAAPVNPVFERPTVSVPSILPVRGARTSSNYGMRTHPVLGRRRMHSGIDLAAPTGTPVYATADGLVSRANRFSSYGLYISIDHGAELETRYAHLSRLAVAAGDRVRKGQVIGYVGSTGRSTGPHLHYEVRVDGVAVNPNPYMVESRELTRLAEQRASGASGRQGNILPGRRRVGAGGGE